jgi:hypothetical protein
MSGARGAPEVTRVQHPAEIGNRRAGAANFRRAREARRRDDLFNNPSRTMLSKFTIDYVLFPHHNRRVSTHRTDDPVEAEDFLMHLLATGSRIVTVRHDAQELEPQQLDRMIRVAVERLASRMLEESLGIDSAAVKHRFGFAA